jgi:AcrR family transcriptional regulator
MAIPKIDRRVERTKKALLNAFIQLFFEHPYSQITTSAIAARANVGRSTLYEHYRSKDDLLAESFRWPLAPLTKLLDANTTASTLLPALTHMWDNRSRARILQSRAARRAMVNVLRESFESNLRSAAREHAAVTAWALAESMIGTITAWLAGELHASPTELATTFIRLAR